MIPCSLYLLCISSSFQWSEVAAMMLCRSLEVSTWHRIKIVQTFKSKRVQVKRIRMPKASGFFPHTKAISAINGISAPCTAHLTSSSNNSRESLFI